MQSICTKYAYNYKHDDASLKAIMTELAKADLVRTIKKRSDRGTAAANSVADTIKQLKTMARNVLQEWYNKDITVSDCNTEYGATTDNSITDTKSRKSWRNQKGCKSKDEDKSDDKEKKRSRKIAPIARSSTNAVHTPAYQITHVSGT